MDSPIPAFRRSNGRDRLLPTELGADSLDCLKPDHFLAIDASTLGSIYGNILISVEKVLLEEKPDIKGITLPGMPWGAPGMEERPKAGPLVVYAFDSSGARPVEYGRE